MISQAPISSAPISAVFGTSGPNVFNDSVTETVTAASLEAAVVTFVASASEAVTAADTVAGGAVYNFSVTETLGSGAVGQRAFPWVN